MLAHIEKEQLLFGINAVQKFVSAKNILPVLSHIKIEAKNSLLFFTATNLDMGAQCQVPAQVSQEGAALIPARHLSEIARRLPDTSVSLEVSPQFELTIRYEQSIFTLKTMDPEDFPSFPDIENAARFSVKADDLKKMTKYSIFAVGTDELRALFTGILWDLNGDALTMVGTDTHRLALSKGTVQTDQPLTGQFIIPSKALGELARLVQDENCQIAITSNLAYFTFENIVIYCRLLEGVFPDYRSVIPKEYLFKIRARTREFLDAVERVALFAASNDDSKTVRLQIENDSMKIFSQSEFGGGDETILVQNEGNELLIAFNCHYLMDGLKSVEAEEIIFEFTEALKPGVMRLIEDDSFTYLILPVRA
jgi:DNA polymerase-3 subunit beta